MYKNYIFDLYGTLIDINTDEEDIKVWEKLALLYAYNGAIYSPKDLQKTYIDLVHKEQKLQKERHPEFKFIDIDITKVFKKLFSLKNICYTDSEIDNVATTFRMLSTKYIKLYDGVIDLLETLKDNNKKIYLLSNAQTSFTLKEIVMFKLLGYFSGILISSSTGTSKPDNAFFSTLFDNFKLKKSESIMIGNDSVADIKGAYDFGIDSLYIHQSISPDIVKPLKSKWSVLDGDVYKIKDLIIKK